MALSDLIFSRYNDHALQVINNISNQLSTLNKEAEVAIKQLLFIRQDPNSINSAEYTQFLTEQLAPVITQFQQASDKLTDIVATHTDTMTASDLATKYSSLNDAVADYAKELLKSRR